jgi:hypothetical protein
MPLAIVQIHELRVGRVVADDDVEITVAVDVDEPARVRTVRRRAEVVGGWKVPGAVAEEDTVDERSVAPLHEDDIEMSIAVHVPDADVGRRLGRGLEKQRAIEAGKGVGRD